MKLISEPKNEALHLDTLDNDAIMYIHKVDSNYNLRMQSKIGHRNPLYSTAIGEILLACRKEEFIRDTLSKMKFVKHTENTLEKTNQVLSKLKKVKELHYAEDKQEIGLKYTAASIYDKFKSIIAATQYLCQQYVSWIQIISA